MTNSESPGIIEGPREPKSQIYIMPQIMLTASKTPQCAYTICLLLLSTLKQTCIEKQKLIKRGIFKKPVRLDQSKCNSKMRANVKLRDSMGKMWTYFKSIKSKNMLQALSESILYF